MNSQTLGRTYYPALDGLRGIAILLVVIYHNFSFLTFFRFGWMGVDLFFVLSGFLITDLLLKTKENGSFLKNFYIRRVLRIFPLYYLTLFIFFLLAPYFFSEKGPSTVFHYYEENKFWFWTYFQNWLFVEKGMAPVPYLSHFWSLAVEEQFYIFWPLIVFFVKDLSKLKKLSIILILIAIVFRFYTRISFPDDVEKYYCSTLTRMDSLLIGGLLAIRLKEGLIIPTMFIKSVSCICVLLLTLVFISGDSLRQDNLILSTVGYTCFAVFFSCVIYLFITARESIISWFKGLHILNYIGKISYGIYVYHIPIYLILGTQFSNVISTWANIDKGQTGICVSVLSLIFTLLASTASFYILEKPILSLKKHFA